MSRGNKTASYVTVEPPGLTEQDPSEEEVGTEGISDVGFSSAAGDGEEQQAGEIAGGDLDREESSSDGSSSDAAQQPGDDLVREESKASSWCEEEEVREDALQDWAADTANHDSSRSSTTAAEGTLAVGEGSGNVAAGLAAMAGGAVSVADIEYLEEQQGRQGLRLMCRAMTGVKASLMLALCSCLASSWLWWGQQYTSRWCSLVWCGWHRV